MARRWLGGAAALALAACSSGGGGSGGGGTTGGTAPTPTPTVVPTPVPVPTPTPVGPPSAAWTAFMTATFEQLFQLDPVYAAYQGRHEFDGRLDDWSEAGIQRTVDFWNATIAAANAQAGLNSDQEFERAYLVQLARGQLFFLVDADMPHRNPLFYIGGGLDPDMYLTREYADLPTRMRATTAMLRAVPAAAAQIRANLRMPLPASYIQLGIGSFDGFATYYANDVPAAFASVSDPALRSDLAAAASAASAAMAGLAQWFRDNAGGATQNFALGADRFLKMLSDSEGVVTTVAALQAAGQADLARNQQALTAACAQFAPGQTVGNCVARMNQNQPSDGLVSAATRQITELRNFVVANDLMTIPGNDPIGVRVTPPYNSANGAYFAPSGAFDANVSAYYYINPNSGMGEANLLFVTAHEVMPGHFQQFLHSNRAPSLIGKLYVTYSFAEGWAHYTEEMLWDAGLRGTAEAHVGQLSNALLRNCRFLAAVGLHAQGMTLAQAQALFQQQCFQGAGTAATQAARGTYDPLYLSYTLGKLMIARLRDDWTAGRGGRAAWKAFHDRFQGYGGPPIPLVRQAMMGEGEARAVF
ncbi:MAG: DUF885 domain-containing protein [Pseudomonadota bacterium]